MRSVEAAPSLRASTCRRFTKESVRGGVVEQKQCSLRSPEARTLTFIGQVISRGLSGRLLPPQASPMTTRDTHSAVHVAGPFCPFNGKRGTRTDSASTIMNSMTGISRRYPRWNRRGDRLAITTVVSRRAVRSSQLIGHSAETRYPSSCVAMSETPMRSKRAGRERRNHHSHEMWPHLHR
jgi:hypothetical protein